MHIAMIGHGPIASYVVRQLADRPDVTVAWVVCRAGREDAAKTAFGPKVHPVVRVDDIGEAVDLAIDCAGHDGLRSHGAAFLRRGVDLITVSNGALADAELAEILEASAFAGGAQLELLSGAVGAIDALAAAKIGGLARVSYVARKPPAGWKGTPAELLLDLGRLTKPGCHFEGSAREAALRYPKNANVAATIALAGTGLDETQVRLIADPAIDANCHEIEAEGAFGKFSFKIEGNPLPDNPKSSALTAMSVVRSVLNRLEPVIP